jgi:uncharacterized protein (DUF885 family)
MVRYLFLAFLFPVLVSCKLMQKNEPIPDNKALSLLLNNYYEERMRLFPLEATQNGDPRYNDQLPVDFTDSYLHTLDDFYSRYDSGILVFNRDALNENDKISYDIFKREMEMSREGIKFHLNGTTFYEPNMAYTPFNQFEGLPISLGQFGSGSGDQPFKTVKDYENWIARAKVFPIWTDSAIDYFRKGIAAGIVLPRTLVLKIIPQMQAMETDDPAKSIFYGPVSQMPKEFSQEDKERLKSAYTNLIKEQLIPSYKKLAGFLQNEYLPHAGSNTGIDALPGGAGYYSYLIRYWTTTDKTREEIYQTGLSEVKRIRRAMDSVKNTVGFTGSLDSFFQYMKTDPRFMPYKTAREVLDAFESIRQKEASYLKDMFGRTPKTGFEIRQTEAFRAASASAEYNQGSPDGSRPGIFYIPIIDPAKFNTTSGMESLFLHEAIPGHHYQVSLQQENKSLPQFRRFLWYGAYGEGWALYCESLGKDLGLYRDPYQYMGAMGDEIHRAIRLVVDVAMHSKGMTREEAIKYMTDNEAISEDAATAEIERYMAIPAQALSYKIGAMQITAWRKKYQQELGERFSLSQFHDELLKDGCMPLDITGKKMDAWARNLQ